MAGSDEDPVLVSEGVAGAAVSAKWVLVKSCHDEFIWGDIYLHFLSFINKEMAQAIEIVPLLRKGPVQLIRNCMINNMAVDDLDQHSFKIWIVAWCFQTITWAITD